MDRTQYLQLRKLEDLSIKRFALIRHYSVEALFIGAAYGIWQTYSQSPLGFFAVPLVAALIFRNFSLMHDAAHRAVSKNKFVNDFIGVVAGSICVLPFEPWRKSHLEHHTWSGNIDRDPVMALVKNFPSFHIKLQGSLGFLWRLWIPAIAVLQYGVFYLLAAKVFVAKRDSLKVMISLIAPAMVWVSLVSFLPSQFTLLILLPAFVFYMVAVEVVNFPHHLQLPQSKGEIRLPVWDQYKTSRSCIYPRWFAQHVVLNFNYHIEHHMFPDAPWYRLPNLQQKIREGISGRYNSDPSFAWIIENRPKHLADVLCYEKIDDEKVRKAS